VSTLQFADATPPMPALRVVHNGTGVDLDAAARAVSDLLIALGHDPSSEHLADTPRRVACAYDELLTPGRST
jgi:GTP cyclohydrolase IA